MTTLTDELLRRRLADRAAGAPATSLAALARSVSAEARPRSAGFGGRWAFAGSMAAAAIVAIVLASGLLSRANPPAVTPGSASPSLGSESSGPASPGSSDAVGPAVSRWGSLSWEQTSPLAFASDETIVNDAIPVGDSFMAVGTTEAGHALTGRVWRSPDGRSWERIDDPAIAKLIPLRILAVGETLVILGVHQTDSGDRGDTVELWRSADALVWTQGPSVPAAADANSAAGGPAGILLPAGHQTFLIGPDLAVWIATAKWPDDVLLGSAVWRHGFWVQSGTTGVRGANGPTRAAVWTSTDGATWSAARVEDATGGMFRVLVAQDGYIGLGTPDSVCLQCFGRFMASQVLWVSADGRTWTRFAPGPSRSAPGIGAQFVGDGHRVLEIGQGGAVVLGGADTSTAADISETLDGLTWTPVASVGAQLDPLALSGEVVIGPRGVALLPGGVIDRSSGAFHPKTWWGAASSAETPTVPPPLPTVTGCDALGFDARRCSAVVARAREQAGNPADVVSVAVRKATPDHISLGGGPIADVVFTASDGTEKVIEIGCLFLSGPSDRVCSPDAQIVIQGGVSHDVPCGPTPCDEQNPGATLPPNPRPAVVAASKPLVLRVFDVPIDHVGHYEVLVGEATLPDGLLSQRSGTLGDPRPTAYWIDQGVAIVVRPGKPCVGPDCPSIESIYHAPFHGPQPVHVYLVFDVVELDATGSFLEVRNLVVR